MSGVREDELGVDMSVDFEQILQGFSTKDWRIGWQKARIRVTASSFKQSNNPTAGAKGIFAVPEFCRTVAPYAVVLPNADIASKPRRRVSRRRNHHTAFLLSTASRPIHRCLIPTKSPRLTTMRASMPPQDAIQVWGCSFFSPL